uniref:Retrotransposon gag domain-containing protein n=1 Tax=Cacopsylla melanoneura TaxID=428564 RepID=A0A8D8XBZ4_9HEMI
MNSNQAGNQIIPVGNLVKIKTPTVTPSIFDGKGDIEEFIRDYNLACSLNQWPDLFKINYLSLYLKGPAKILHDNEIRSKAINTWAEVENILRKFYVPVGNNDRLEYEMLTRKQFPTETSEEYCQAKINLINKYDPNMGEDRKVKLLLYGLLPDLIAKIVCMGSNNTIEELRQNIRKTDLANYMVNVRVKGFERHAIEPQAPVVLPNHVNAIYE